MGKIHFYFLSFNGLLFMLCTCLFMDLRSVVNEQTNDHNVHMYWSVIKYTSFEMRMDDVQKYFLLEIFMK